MRDLETIRAYVERTLPPEERAAIETDITRDPELRRLVATYALVHEATADAPPPCATRYSDLALANRAPRSRAWWRAAAAAVLLAGAALALAQALRPQGPVKLTAIPLAPPPAPPSLPELLGDYRPVEDGVLWWLDDLDEARALAKTLGRPLFLFVHHPTCPYCIEMDRDVFTDPLFQTAANGFVLVRVHVARFGEDLPGWPVYRIETERGADVLTGRPDALTLAARMNATGAPPPRWDELAASRVLHRAGRWAELARRDDPFGEHARAYLARAAWEAVHDARSAATAEDALRRLRVAREELADTDYAADLDALIERIEDDGAFPEVTS